MDDQRGLHGGARPPARRRCPPYTREGQTRECQITTGTPDDRPDPAAREGVGRSRGGRTSKIHLACDGRGQPLSIMLTAGNVNDYTRFGEVLAGIGIPQIGPGRPRTRPDHVLADKAYSTKAIRASLRRGIAHTIPERDDQKNNRRRTGHASSQPPAFDPTQYKARNVVERCFNRLKQFRDLATRYAKRGHYDRAEVVLASLITWLAT